MFSTAALRRSKRRDTSNAAQTSSADRQRDYSTIVSSPPPGTDSCYGVRSLNGSVTWDPSTSINVSPQVDEASSSDPSIDTQTEGEMEGRASAIESGGAGNRPPGNMLQSNDNVNFTSQLSMGNEAGSEGDEDVKDGTFEAGHSKVYNGGGDGLGFGSLGEDNEVTPTPEISPLPPHDHSSHSYHSDYMSHDHINPFEVQSPNSAESAESPTSPNMSQPIGRIAHAGSKVEWGMPSSPDETLHPLSRSTDEAPGLASLLHHNTLHPSPSALAPDLLGDDMGSSVPSSPASFTSLPSYGASLSSLSRTSSPISGISGPLTDYHSRSTPSYGYLYDGSQSGQGSGSYMSQGSELDDLVLPTLSLPSSSIHLSLPKWHQEEVSVVKVALLGGTDVTEDVMAVLRERAELVELSNGQIGVVRDGALQYTLLLCHSAEQLRKRVSLSYAVLASLLNPRPPKGSELELRKLVAEYAKRSEWIHTVVVLDDTNVNALRTLVRICETDASSTPSRASTPSPLTLPDEPTPMPSTKAASSYFSYIEPTSRTGIRNMVDLIIGIEDELEQVESRSIDMFIEHRPNIKLSSTSSLEASITSDGSYPYSRTSSAFDSTSPMPTVARASGGGEWEAGYSRRVAADAQKKEKPSSTRGRPHHRGSKSTSTSRKHHAYSPLFPAPGPEDVLRIVHNSSTSHSIWSGFKDIWSSVFGLPKSPITIVEPPKEKPGPATLPAETDEEKRYKRSTNIRRWKWRVASVALVAIGVGLWTGAVKIDMAANIKF